MGGRGKGLKKKARVNVFVLKWMDKSIGDEPNLCGNYVHLARHGLCRIYALLSRIRFCREYALFWVYFVQTFTQTSRILLRFCADICPKYRRLGPLHEGKQSSSFLESGLAGLQCQATQI